ncbi:hypothetical protein Taro_035919, partial [Colocasia esculenta]|nr:hypothetical protein [Colocasia esculenta]
MSFANEAQSTSIANTTQQHTDSTSVNVLRARHTTAQADGKTLDWTTHNPTQADGKTLVWTTHTSHNPASTSQ